MLHLVLQGSNGGVSVYNGSGFSSSCACIPSLFDGSILFGEECIP